MPGNITGGCLCGQLRYESRLSAVRGVICHCSMCKRHSGAAALALAIFRTDGFSWQGREPSWHASSPHADRAFCPACGSSIAMREHDEPSVVEIYAGSLDRPDDLVIEDHVWASERTSWLHLDDGLPHYPQARPHGQ